MKICKNCKSKNIKIRRNYSHGRKSKPIFSMICRECNSSDIVEEQNKFRRRK